MRSLIFILAILAIPCALWAEETTREEKEAEIADTVKKVVEAKEASETPPPAKPAAKPVAPPAAPPAQPAVLKAPAPVKTPPAPPKVPQKADPKRVGSSKVTFKSDGDEIESLVETIRQAADINIVMDTGAIGAGVAAGTVRTNITLKVDNMTLKSALNWICRLAGLAWTLQDEAIFISTPERIGKGKEKMVVYDIRDLSAPIQDFPGPQIELVAGEADISVNFNN